MAHSTPAFFSIRVLGGGAHTSISSFLLGVLMQPVLRSEWISAVVTGATIDTWRGSAKPRLFLGPQLKHATIMFGIHAVSCVCHDRRQNCFASCLLEYCIGKLRFDISADTTLLLSAQLWLEDLSAPNFCMALYDRPLLVVITDTMLRDLLASICKCMWIMVSCQMWRRLQATARKADIIRRLNSQRFLQLCVMADSSAWPPGAEDRLGLPVHGRGAASSTSIVTTR